MLGFRIIYYYFYIFMKERYRKLLASVAVAGTIATGGEAVAQSSAEKLLDIQGKLDIASSYTGTQGDQLAGLSLQPSLTINYKKANSLTLWGNLPLERINGLKTDELDVIAARTTKIKGLDVETGLGFFTLGLDYKGEKTRINIFEPYIAVSKSFESAAGVTTPRVEANADLFLDGKKAYNAKLGVSHEFPKVLGVTPGVRGEVFQRFGDIPAGDGARVGADVLIPLTKDSDIRIAVDKYFTEQNKQTVGHVVFHHKFK